MGISFVEKYENLSDEDLVSEFKANNHNASVVLLRRYMTLIKMRASAFYNGSIEMDDLVQEGIISFYLGIRNYDSSLSSFPTFARLCVDRGIISVIRSYARKKHIPQDKLVPIEDASAETSSSSPEDILIEAEDVTALEYNIKVLLSKLEYKVFLLYLHNYSRAEIAKQLQLSEKSVGNTIYRIKKKMKSI